MYGAEGLNIAIQDGHAATQDCQSQKVTMGRELMAPRADRTMHIPSGVASPVTTNHTAKVSVLINLRNASYLKEWQVYGAEGLNIAIQDGRAAGQSVAHVSPPPHSRLSYICRDRLSCMCRD